MATTLIDQLTGTPITVTHDQVTGRGETVAYKAPCRVATTASITLNDLQSIDDVTLLEGDRVLVLAQSDARQNGVYIASTSAWVRAIDFNSNRDVTKGTRLNVTNGTLNAGREYVLTTDNPIVIGTSAIAISETLSSDTGGNAAAAAASAVAAAGSASAADTHRQDAATSASNAADSATTATTKADEAATSATAAAASSADALASKNAAAGSATTAGSAAGAASSAASAAFSAADTAIDARDYAYDWASAPVGTPVNDGVNPVGMSAYHWAKEAEGSAGGGVMSVTEGDGVSVDNTDPKNPKVGLNTASKASLVKADEAVQPDDLTTALQGKITKAVDTGLGGFQSKFHYLPDITGGSITPETTVSNFQIAWVSAAWEIIAPPVDDYAAYEISLTIINEPGAGPVTITGFSNNDIGTYDPAVDLVHEFMIKVRGPTRELFIRKVNV